jgi:hypothetical protein
MLRPRLLLILAVLPSLTVAQDALDPRDQKALEEFRAARKAWLEPGISTSLDDANTDVPFLDDFRPVVFHPLGEMPRIRGYGYLFVAPGCYQMDAPTFCLHAGSYGPGGGDGYALAPLRGKAAGLVHTVLWNWTEHPEIPQTHVQLVVWALTERKAVSELPQERQAVAQTLLGPDGVAAADAAAKGPEPEIPGITDPNLAAEFQGAAEDMEAAFAGAQADMERAQEQVEEMGKRMERGEAVPPEVFQQALERLMASQTALFERFGPAAQRMAEATARFEQLMTVAEAAFEDIEREAVLQGDPEPLPGSRPIPETRWSYHAGGLFIRCFPEHYSRSRIEVSVPATVQIERDAQGRISQVTDELGNRLAVVYEDTGRPAALPGDAGLKASALREITVTPAKGEAARVAGGWAFTGVPEENGSPDAAPAEFAGLRQRYEQAREHVLEVSRLVAALSAPAEKPPTDVPIAADVADILDLAHLADAVRPSVPEEDEEAPEAVVLRLIQQAWQAAVCRRVAPLPGARLRSGATAAALRGRSANGVRLAALQLPRALLVQRAGAAGDRLPALDPGWDGMNPGNRGRQRLGMAPMQHPASDGKQVLRDAVKGCEFLQAALDVFNGLSDPVGWLMEKMGLGTGGMPGMILGEMVQWMFDMGAAISQALGGDPPRADFTAFDMPPPPELPVLEPAEWLSADRARAGNAMAASLRDLYVSLRAAQISLDRTGGALEDGDESWARQQALAFIHYKRRAAECMVTVSEQYDALLEIMEEEGAEAESIELAQVEAHLQAVREKGFRPESLEAARRLDLSDEQIEAARQRRLSFAPEDDLDDPLTLARQTSGVLLDLGEYWLTLPDVPPPVAP